MSWVSLGKVSNFHFSDCRVLFFRKPTKLGILIGWVIAMSNLPNSSYCRIFFLQSYKRALVRIQHSEEGFDSFKEILQNEEFPKIEITAVEFVHPTI